MIEITPAIEARLVDTAREAGAITLKYFQDTNVDVERKGDNSPVTIADQEAEDFILPILKSIAPNVPIVA